MSIKIATSFDVGSNVPVDDRLVMNSTELKNVNDNTMPDSYLCVCPDLDGKIFIYNKAFELDPEFGRFRPFSGDNSLITTEAEYLALPEEDKLNNSYYLYDIGVHYKNGVAYSRKKPIQLTMEEYKALGEVNPDQEYIITSDEQGILFEAEDIGYNNAESGIQATTVQGAIDKVVNEVIHSYFYPTGVITDIEVGENGAIYISPSDGFVQVTISGVTDIMGYASIITSNPANSVSLSNPSGNNQRVKTFVKKGEEYRVYYSVGENGLITLKHYALV